MKDSRDVYDIVAAGPWMLKHAVPPRCPAEVSKVNNNMKRECVLPGYGKLGRKIDHRRSSQSPEAGVMPPPSDVISACHNRLGASPIDLPHLPGACHRDFGLCFSSVIFNQPMNRPNELNKIPKPAKRGMLGESIELEEGGVQRNWLVLLGQLAREPWSRNTT